jgi:hypothetical protein
MKVKEILDETGNFGPASDISIKGPYNMNDIRGPFDISTPNSPEQEENSEDEVPEDDDEGETLCGHCNGTGEGMYDGSRCGMCRGSGVIKHEEGPDPDEWYDRKRDSQWDGSGADLGGWSDDD